MTTLRQLVTELAPLIEVCSESRHCKLTLDLSAVQFVRPTGLGALTALLLWGQRHGQVRWDKVIKPREGRVDGYLSRMGFYDLLDLPDGYFFGRRRPQSSFRELVEVASVDAIQDVAKDIGAIFRNRTDIGDAAAYSIKFAIGELVDNVFHHAESPVNPILCAQAYDYDDHKQVEFAIVDCGCGFAASLARNPRLRARFRTSAEALQLAVQSRVTGSPDTNTGEGLFFTTELAKQNGGRAMIYSQDGLLDIQGDRQTPRDGVHWWPGAIVSVCLRVDGPIDVVALFNRFAPPDNDFSFLTGSDDDDVPF